MIDQQPITMPNRSAAFLRAKRESLGLSVREAAERIGISAQTLRRYEHQGLSSRVRFSRVDRLCCAYSISVNHLLSLAMQPA